MDAKSLEAGYSNNFLLRKFKGYYELMKPRVMSLVIFTAFVGMFLAPGQITLLNQDDVIIMQKEMMRGELKIKKFLCIV